MSSETSSRFMRFVTKAGFFGAIFFAVSSVAAASFQEIIRQAARDNGFVPAEQTHAKVDRTLLVPGEVLFKSKALSLNGNIACQTCHLDEFGSADGIPNAVAVGGTGKGRTRALGGGGILPRNTLPFWGRGGEGFSVFFWDGKIDFAGASKVSQFGETRPSDDPLITAIHLPVVEIREMLAEDKTVLSNKTETIQGAEALYSAIINRLREKEAKAMGQLASAFDIKNEDLTFLHVAKSLASFIRHKFRVRETRFHRFVFGDGQLTAEELRGAQLFYGKGKCSTCHSGPYFTDFQFHAVPLPQIGFGKNGFGIDYGRFNVTHDPNDLYKFRTPPLLNVEKTAPYGHSGSVPTIRASIIHHFDPLRDMDTSKMSALDRHEYFKRLAASADITRQIGFVDDEEVNALVAFLNTLTYEMSK